ncbi:Uma2 family endonuclease [Sphingomonas sp. S1-29]|uniref:Uma2 family endonuclease n=1 Tax=Sphingomonas sp. S1-29 TaxID=2991074 RepID=UPI00223F6341|nr:Uma2 family endonuclease [Sphingomonas sp. S1-29]UZK70082.1 Uma2 family endonuclease [Sphingomonas sp. S1-29]
MNETLPLEPITRPIGLRIEDYLLLDGAGTYEAVGKTELIEGEVFAVNSEYRPHTRIKSRLHLLIARGLELLDSDLEAAIEGSVAMPPANAPMPDIVVTSEIEGDGLIPVPSVRLIVEVADASLHGDLTRKAAIYARHAVPEYWVVDVNGRVVHQLSAPSGDGYIERRAITFGSAMESVAIPGLRIATSTL